ncbi:hypothetical protein L218DRAFT_940647 [Marasmius fiardii PR-910]|nr:hypothetical protein L218DRAFT_940647 [Marasmius fiardii PR-910]
MADTDTIVVDDTSPTILYSPFADTFGTPDFAAGWNPLFNKTSLGGAPFNVGNSTTAHVTSRDGASFLINFQGTGIQLMGSAIQADYQVSLDNRPQTQASLSPDQTKQILATISGLSNANHTITLTTVTNNPLSSNQSVSFIVFDAAVVTSPALSSNFSSQSLTESAVSFVGKWNSSSLHQSNTVNDKARASFKGTSLQILGTVSPGGGDYSVTLDNTTTQLSARSLDPNKTHTYEITNESGGTLILATNGTIVFASGEPDAIASSTPSSSATPVGATSKGSSLSPGTIAALALAGILGFLMITGLLFFFFVYRPRKKRRKHLKRATRPTPRPSDLILDIAPRFNGQHNDDYTRWKRDVEGGNTSKDLGIVFRHTPSPKDKRSSDFDYNSAADHEEFSARSFSISPSSKPSSKNGGSKESKAGSLKSWLSGKKKGSSSSSTPSYTIDLPPLRAPASPHVPPESHPDLSQASHSLVPPRSSFSGVTSLSYLSESSNASRQFSFNRPDESTQNLRGRTDSHGLLLIDDNVEQRPEHYAENVSVYPATVSTQQHAPQVFVEEVASSYEESVQSRPSGYQGLSRNASTRTDDRGSVRTYDDGLSVLGASTARAAIRGLSPRTSESVSSFATFGVYPSRRTDESFPGHLNTLEESPPIPSTTTSVPEEPKSTTLLPDLKGKYVDVRTSSPFQVDFGHPLPHPPRTSQGNRGSAAITRLNRMSVRFDEDQVIIPTNRGENVLGGVKPLPQPPRAPFRLTPLVPLAPSPPTGSSEVDSPSFLDFDVGGSSDASLPGSSNEQTSSSRAGRPQSSSFLTRPMGSRSRWSTTTPSSLNRQDSISSPSSQVSADPSSPSSSFPFPTSLPASPFHPEGHKPSPPTSPAVVAVAVAANTPNNGAEVHLSELNPVSPVESVPMSISDLHFRQSDTDDISENGVARRPGFRLPPHPPLPAIPPTPTHPVTNTDSSDIESSVPAPTTRSSLPLTYELPTSLPSTAVRQTRTHTRTLSGDLLSSQGRRPLGPRVRDSQH